MKTIFITLVSLVFTAYTSINQEQITVDVTYDGYYDGTYGFTTVTEDEDDFGDTIEFKTISKELLKKYDLKTDAYDYQSFTITYVEEANGNNTLVNIIKTEDE